MTKIIPILAIVGVWVMLLVATVRINAWFWMSYRSILAADSAPDRLAIYFLCVRMLFLPKTAWKTVADAEVAAAMKECGERWPQKLSPFLYGLGIFLFGSVGVLLLAFLTAMFEARLAG